MQSPGFIVRPGDESQPNKLLTIKADVMHKTFQSPNAIILIATVLTMVIALSKVAVGQTSAPKSERELLAILRSEAAEAEKALACKNLSIYGSSEAVPELAKLLA